MSDELWAARDSVEDGDSIGIYSAEPSFHYCWQAGSGGELLFWINAKHLPHLGPCQCVKVRFEHCGPVVKAHDKPLWLDTPSGLAAVAEWRGWTMCCVLRNRKCRWEAHSEQLAGANYSDTIDAAKSAAELWVREQAGKDGEA